MSDETDVKLTAEEKAAKKAARKAEKAKNKPDLNAETNTESKVEDKKVTAKPDLDATDDPKEVVEKAKRVKSNPPPLPLVMVKGIANPLLTGSRFKRALSVALAQCTMDDDILCKSIVEVGIVKKFGLNPDVLDTGNLNSVEFSGKGYGINFARRKGAAYMEKNADKVKECLPFAKEVIDALTNGTDPENLRRAGLEDINNVKSQIAKWAEEHAALKKAKKAKDEEGKEKSGKKDKPSKKVKPELEDDEEDLADEEDGDEDEE